MPLPDQSRPVLPISPYVWAAYMAGLAAAVVLVHGFHPFAEDGGLYAAGVEYTLDHRLFPHDTAFVTAHLRFSLFAPLVAMVVRVSHLSLVLVLLALDWLTAWTTLLAAAAVLSRCTSDRMAQIVGVLTLAAGWTLPIAGTSLYLMDPYVTARSLAMPFSLTAIACALQPWTPNRWRNLRHPALLCGLGVSAACLFHPLMAAYGLLFVLAIRASWSANRNRQLLRLGGGVLLLCLVATVLAPSASGPEHLAAISRYYWFLSQWHWYEWLGLAGPMLMLALVARPLRAEADRDVCSALLSAAAFTGCLCIACALLFAHESARAYPVARVQPLRSFVLVYAIMLLLLGAGGVLAWRRAKVSTTGIRGRLWAALPYGLLMLFAAGLFAAERDTYPHSPHIELSLCQSASHNGWVQAFLWIRSHTPETALVALDARYVNTPGEDAQVFRAFALRSAVPDFSKDGGEASITPALGPAWIRGAEAQRALGGVNDATRDARLQPFGVTWMVLPAAANTRHTCPYANATVKVCQLP